jgi:hypothetical protein
MADILLWSSFAVRSSDPALADAMLTAYATVVLAVLVPLFIWVRFFKPAAPAAAEPSHLIWKPLRLTPMDHNADLRREPQPVQPKDSEFLIYDMWGQTCDDGTEATDTFLLSDLKMGESVLAGYTTSGKWAYGVVTGYKEGQYFSFDGPNEGSLLWRGLLLMRGPMADAALKRYKMRYEPTEDGDSPRGVPMKRTDSGTNYGFTAYPDVAFWKRSGCPLYWEVTSDDYSDIPNYEAYPDRIRSMGELMDAEEHLTEITREAMEQQAERLYNAFISYITFEDPDPRWQLEQLERLNAAWELREEGEIVE